MTSTCPSCLRTVDVNRGAIAWHTTDPSSPLILVCPGSGGPPPPG